VLHDNTLYRWARLAHSDRDSGSCATVNAHHGANRNAHSALVSQDGGDFDAEEPTPLWLEL